jgi:threonylcarbamoyladenosine tRNA methylthiotransferase MtaB
LFESAAVDDRRRHHLRLPAQHLESEVIRREAEQGGLDNAIVVNTCAVTNEAVRQARQAIRRAAPRTARSRIVVTGCAAQTKPQMFAAMPEVDLVLGNEEKLKARATMARCRISASARARRSRQRHHERARDGAADGRS